MPTQSRSTRPSSRRSFIVTAGTALSAPIAVAAATLPASPAVDLDDPSARLARLEAMAAIRALNQQYARSVNVGERDALAGLFADPSAAAIDPAIRSLVVDSAAGDDAIEVAPDGRSATARLHRVVEVEDAIGPSCPLVDMAREQGGGTVRRRGRVLLENAYVQHDGVWKIHRTAWRPVE